MSVFELLSPVFALALLTFGLLFWMLRLRYRATATRAVPVKNIALGQPAWPASVTKIDRAFHNQLELPLLFYILVVLELVTRNGDSLLEVLAWLFVVLRYAHAFVHTTSNNVLHRFAVFVVGAATLAVMWVDFAIKISWVY